MGGTQSKLNVFLKEKNGRYKSGGYEVTTSKTIFTKWINFEVVTHKIDITKYPTYYDVYLYNCKREQCNSNYIFAYCSPSDKSQVVDKVNVYYSILAPDNPLVISFITKSQQIYNCEYSKLLSARWDYASNISKYNFRDLSEEKLFELYRRQSFNKKIQLKTDSSPNVDISGYKEEIGSEEHYRIVFVPKGSKSVLRSECLFELDTNTKQPKCPKSQESSDASKPAASPSPPAQSNITSKYTNQINPYYLTSVKDHFFDGIMVYFARDKNQRNTNNSRGANGVGQTNHNGRNNGKAEEQKEKEENNMALLLEFVDTYKIRTHIQRIDKHGLCWSEEKFYYRDIKTLESVLNGIKKSAEKNVSTTFILENKQPYVGVEVKPGDTKITYIKYTHSATKSDKPNIIFEREVVRKIGDFDLSFNTKTLDVYFLKTTASTDKWPFILMFKNENDKATESKPAAAAGANGATSGGGGEGGGGGGSGAKAQGENESNPKNKCYYFDTTNDFEKWHELTVDNEEKKIKQKENDLNGLDKKLEAKLDKIETNGKCQTELYLLRNIAFYILKTEDHKPEDIEEIKKETRPTVLPLYEQKGTGTSLPVVLGSVAAGLVVLGIISAIIYGIYWYNTTIKLLT